MVVRSVVVLVLCISAAPAFLLAWSSLYPLGCWSLLIPLVFSAVVAVSLIEHLLWRRRCLATCLFEPSSLVHRFLMRSLLLSGFALLVAMVASVLLMMSVPGWSFPVLALYMGDALLIVLLFLVMQRLVVRIGVKGPHTPQVTRSWTIALNVLLMMALLVFIELTSPPPEYLRQSPGLAEAVDRASASVGSVCPIVDSAVRIARESDAASWWLMLRASEIIETTQVRWLAWLWFLFSGGLTVWVYGHFCTRLLQYALMPPEATDVG